MADSTYVSFEQVKAGVDTIKDCAIKMEAIFGDFGQSMKVVNGQGLFEGETARTLEERFNSLKTKFDDYVKLVNTFADMITGATENTRETDERMAKAAEELAGK